MKKLSKYIYTLAVILSAQSNAAITCEKINIDSFKKKHLSKKYNLIFFASWCGECKKHLQKEKGEDNIYISYWDDKKKAETALSFLGIKRGLCIDDHNQKIANFFGVKKIPTKLKN